MKIARLVSVFEIRVGDEVSVADIAGGAWLKVIEAPGSLCQIRVEELDDLPVTRWPIYLWRTSYVVRR